MRSRSVFRVMLLVFMFSLISNNVLAQNGEGKEQDRKITLREALDVARYCIKYREYIKIKESITALKEKIGSPCNNTCLYSFLERLKQINLTENEKELVVKLEELVNNYNDCQDPITGFSLLTASGEAGLTSRAGNTNMMQVLLKGEAIAAAGSRVTFLGNGSLNTTRTDKNKFEYQHEESVRSLIYLYRRYAQNGAAPAGQERYMPPPDYARKLGFSGLYLAGDFYNLTDRNRRPMIIRSLGGGIGYNDKLIKSIFFDAWFLLTRNRDVLRDEISNEESDTTDKIQAPHRGGGFKMGGSLIIKPPLPDATIRQDAFFFQPNNIGDYFFRFATSLEAPIYKGPRTSLSFSTSFTYDYQSIKYPQRDEYGYLLTLDASGKDKVRILVDSLPTKDVLMVDRNALIFGKEYDWKFVCGLKITWSR